MHDLHTVTKYRLTHYQCQMEDISCHFNSQPRSKSYFAVGQNWFV
jgi:hypothetical protein